MSALDPGLAGYLTSNRDFLAPAVEAAVMSLPLPPGARVLDAGTGAGGALPPLARAAGALGPGHLVVDEPGFFVVHPTLLATGRTPT